MQTIFSQLVAPTSVEDRLTGLMLPPAEGDKGGLSGQPALSDKALAQSFETVFDVLVQAGEQPGLPDGPTVQESESLPQTTEETETPDKVVKADAVREEGIANTDNPLPKLSDAPSLERPSLRPDIQPEQGARPSTQIAQDNPTLPQPVPFLPAQQSLTPPVQQRGERRPLGSAPLPIPLSQRGAEEHSKAQLAEPMAENPPARRAVTATSTLPSLAQSEPGESPLKMAAIPLERSTEQPLRFPVVANPVGKTPLPSPKPETSVPSPDLAAKPATSAEGIIPGNVPALSALQPAAQAGGPIAVTLRGAEPSEVLAISGRTDSPQEAKVFPNRSNPVTTAIQNVDRPSGREKAQPMPSTAVNATAATVADEMMQTVQNREIAQPDDVTVIQQVIRLKGTGPIASADPQVVPEQSAGSRLRTALRPQQTPAMTPPQPVVATTDLHKQQTGRTLSGGPDQIGLPPLNASPATIWDVQVANAETTRNGPPFRLDPAGPRNGALSGTDLPPQRVDIQNSPPDRQVFPDVPRPMMQANRKPAGPVAATVVADTPKPDMIAPLHPANRAAQNKAVQLSEAQVRAADTTPPSVIGQVAQSVNSEKPVLLAPATPGNGKRVREPSQAPQNQPTEAPIQKRPGINRTFAGQPAISDLVSAPKTAGDRPVSAPSSLQAESLISIRADPLSPVAPQTQTAPARMDLPAHVARQIADVAQHLPSRPVEISLSPEELGRVRLSVSPSDSGLTVNVLAERPETLDLMRRHIHTLEQEFQSLGYEGVAFSFSDGRRADGERDQRAAAPPQQEHYDIQPGQPAPARQITRAPADNAGLDLRL